MPYSTEDSQNLLPEEELKLIKAAKSGDEHSRNEILSRFVKMVYLIANKFFKMTPDGPVSKISELPDLEDLVQQGLIFLNEAIYKYDINNPSKARFFTFAYKHVYQSLFNMSDIRTQKQAPWHEIDVEKTEEELQRQRDAGVPEDQLEKTKKIRVLDKPHSLEKPIPGAKPDDDTRTLADVLQKKENEFAQVEWNMIVDKVYNDLPDAQSKKVWIELVRRKGEPGIQSSLAKELGVAGGTITNIIRNRIMPMVKRHL